MRRADAARARRRADAADRRRRATRLPGLAARHLGVPAALAAHRGPAAHPARARRRAAARPVDGQPAGQRRRSSTAWSSGTPWPTAPAGCCGPPTPDERRTSTTAAARRGLHRGAGRARRRARRRRWWPSCASSTTHWTGQHSRLRPAAALTGSSPAAPAAGRRPRSPRRRTPPARRAPKHHWNADSVGKRDAAERDGRAGQHRRHHGGGQRGADRAHQRVDADGGAGLARPARRRGSGSAWRRSRCRHRPRRRSRRAGAPTERS